VTRPKSGELWSLIKYTGEMYRREKESRVNLYDFSLKSAIINKKISISVNIKLKPSDLCSKFKIIYISFIYIFIFYPFRGINKLACCIRVLFVCFIIRVLSKF